MNAAAHRAGIQTVSDRLDRALEIGRELLGIHLDPGLHSLSRQAWQRQSLDLGRFSSAADLQACRTKIANTRPYLHAEIEIRGKLWAGSHQDRPAIYHGFAQGDGPMAAAYAERLAGGLSVEQCSAIAAWRCGEMRPDTAFGKLESFSDLQALLEPRQIELAQLDQQLSAMILLCMLSWSPTGPMLRHAGHELLIDAGNATALATGLAELVQRQPAQLPAAA